MRPHGSRAADAPHSVSMADVARVAGVSQQTVSRVVNDQANVKAATRERVLAAMEELGFRPNYAGRSLRGGSYRAVGLFMPDLMYAGNLATLNGLMADYRIDTDRLYTTGQSMGCMTSLYLNSKYPDLFAASLFVSGQWDISVLQPLEEQKFFYITAGGDEKASGGQDEVRVMFDADGVGYSYGTWNAQNLQEEQNAAAESLIAQGYQANMIRFEKGSVLTEGSGMEHNASFNYGYKIPAVRDWLFAQTKSGQ